MKRDTAQNQCVFLRRKQQESSSQSKGRLSLLCVKKSPDPYLTLCTGWAKCWLMPLHAMFWWENKHGFGVPTTGSKYFGHITILSSLFTSLWRKNFFLSGLKLDKISPVCTTLFLCCFRCHLPTYSKHKPWLKVWSQHKIHIICSDYLNRNTFLCSKMICSALWSSNRCSMKLLWNAITQMTTRLYLHILNHIFRCGFRSIFCLAGQKVKIP